MSSAVWLVVVGVLPIWSLWRWRRRTTRQERAIRELRAFLSGSIELWPDPAPAAGVRGQFERVAADIAGLQARGFVSLGEIAVIFQDKAVQVMRTFVDEAGTTFAYFVVSLDRYAPPMFIFECYSDDAEWSTLRAARRGPHSADAPFVHAQALPRSLGLDELLAKHRDFTGRDADDASLLRCTTAAALCRLLTRNHDRAARWRAAQPSDDLLQADLRGILGDSYERAGAWWTERLTAPLPSARLRRRQ